MARTVKKSIAKTTVFALDANKDFGIDNNGNFVANLVFEIAGSCTENKARLQACKLAGHNNVMVLSLQVLETAISVSPALFFLNGNACKEGQTYGRDYVTQTFKVTRVRYITLENGQQVPHTYVMIGTTTTGKLRKAVADECGTQNFVLLPAEVAETRMYLRRDKFLELARAESSRELTAEMLAGTYGKEPQEPQESEQ